MENQFWLWIYNIVISKEFLSSIFGGIIAGITSILVAKITLSSEFKNERALDDSKQNQLEQSKFLLIKDELERNKIIIQKYIESISITANVNSYDLDNAFKYNGIGRPSDEAWREARSTLFLSDKIELIKEISKLYQDIYSMITLRHVSVSVLKSTLEKLTEVVDKICDIYEVRNIG